jgi:hypothetical protein
MSSYGVGVCSSSSFCKDTKNREHDQNILKLLDDNKNNFRKMRCYHLFIVSLQNNQIDKRYDIHRKSQQNIQSGHP